MNIDLLVDRLQLARDAYYNGTPIMTDEVYDLLEDELRALAPNHPLLKRVGANVPASSGWAKVAHKIPMGSLNKAQTTLDLAQWHRDCGGIRGHNALIATDKLDGISVSFWYFKGRLSRAITRGDGDVGEDITRNVMLMKGCPHDLLPTYDDTTEGCRVQIPEDVWVRGEIVVTKTDFDAHFKGESNPRNTASGTAKRQSNASMCRHLTVISYQFLPNGVPLATKEAELQALADMGFDIPNWKVFNDLDDINVYYQRYVNYARGLLDYQIDGLVVEVNDAGLREMLGDLNGRPKAAIAFKFPHESKRTFLRGIVWQVGKSGRITPVAEFDPVNLGGVKVERASLHTVRNVQDLRLFKGCQVLVSRRNDCIPYLEANLDEPLGAGEA